MAMDPELLAIQKITHLLNNFEPQAAERVLSYAAQRVRAEKESEMSKRLHAMQSEKREAMLRMDVLGNRPMQVPEFDQSPRG